MYDMFYPRKFTRFPSGGIDIDSDEFKSDLFKPKNDPAQSNKLSRLHEFISAADNSIF